MGVSLESLFSLQGCTAVVTGGTSGIGEMLARGLLIAGAKVFIGGRDKVTADERAAELNEFGPCEAIAADVSTTEGRQHLVTELAARAPNLSILVNNAGMTSHNPLGQYTEAQWDAVYAINVKAPFMLGQALHPLLKANASSSRPAHIVNVGSMAAMVARTPNSFAYGGSKAALQHLTRVLAAKLAPDHIHVNAIAPGLFPSRMSAWIVDDAELLKSAMDGIPLGRPGEPDDLAVLVIAIVASRYMTGDIILLDGGATL